MSTTSGLPRQDFGRRRDAVRAVLADLEVGALLVTDPRNVRYLSGFSGSNGQLLVTTTPAEDRLVTDERYEGRVATEAPDVVCTLARDPVGVALVVAAASDATLGAEAAHLSWAAGRGLLERAGEAGVRVLATTGVVEALREVKDDAEIARLARACTLTEESLEWLVTEVAAPGRSERELATVLERRFVDAGADGVAFPSIVASGPNSAIPHHESGSRLLATGDLLTIDCGALVDGYHADHTRTFAIGSVAGRLAEVHEVVVEAQAAGRAAAVAGAPTVAVDAAARDLIETAGYGEGFVHGTGHGVGLAIHEAPAVGRESAGSLVANVALTVEPGVYLPGIGGVRIEDTIVVTADGPARPLTDTPRELRIL